MFFISFLLGNRPPHGRVAQKGNLRPGHPPSSRRNQRVINTRAYGEPVCKYRWKLLKAQCEPLQGCWERHAKKGDTHLGKPRVEGVSGSREQPGGGLGNGASDAVGRMRALGALGLVTIATPDKVNKQGNESKRALDDAKVCSKLSGTGLLTAAFIKEKLKVDGWKNRSRLTTGPFHSLSLSHIKRTELRKDAEDLTEISRHRRGEK